MATRMEVVRDEAILPPSITYQDPTQLMSQRLGRMWSILRTPIEAIGRVLRNTLFLPLYSKKVDTERAANQRLAERASHIIMGAEPPQSEELRMIHDCFSVRDMVVRVNSNQTTSKDFTVRVFESKEPIEGKKLRVVLFSFNGNKEVTARAQPWNPLQIEEVSKAPLLVMQALQQSGIRVDSFITNSLGNVALSGLKHFQENLDFIKRFPPTVIINRGLTSVQKVANRLFSFPLNYILHGLARLCGWDANPENDFLSFLQRNPQSVRKVVMIEAQNDFFFSGAGAPDADVHSKISRLGIGVFRAQFWPFPFHSRSHHAITAEHLRNNSETKVLAQPASCTTNPDESVADMIARNVFLSDEGEDRNTSHTSFCVGGADATLDTGTIREVMPLLSSFVEEGLRQTANRALREMGVA